MPLEIILLPTGHSVHNVRGSSLHKANAFGYDSWKKLWVGETPWNWSWYCAKEDCFDSPYGGSHVHIEGTSIRLYIFVLFILKKERHIYT